LGLLAINGSVEVPIWFQGWAINAIHESFIGASVVKDSKAKAK
jgi:hypothetical protein